MEYNLTRYVGGGTQRAETAPMIYPVTWPDHPIARSPDRPITLHIDHNSLQLLSFASPRLTGQAGPAAAVKVAAVDGG